MTLAAVTDAGPIIHLGEIDALGLLSLFDPLLVPATVHDEVERGGLPSGFEDLPYELVEPPADGPCGPDLDAGERAAIAVATSRDVILLTDDLSARQEVPEAGVPVHGSIGIIALGYGRDRLGRDEAETLIRTLQIETSLFVSDAVVERGIRLLEES